MAPKPTLSGQTYYPSLDGLRGLAILLVLFMHLFPFVPLSRFGWIGVDLFFVLSGFLITNILLAERQKRWFAGKFYIRRWLRTMPLYLLALVVVLYVLPGFYRDKEPFSYLLANQKWFWFQLQNFLFFLKPVGNQNMLNHFWSLAVEEQFYLLIPIVFLLVGSVTTLLNTCIVVLVAMEVLRLTIWFARVPGLSYEMLYSFTRIDGLCIGTAIALVRSPDFAPVIYRRIRLLPAVFAVFSVCMIIYRFVFHFPLPLKATCIYPAVAIGWGLVLRKSLKPADWLQTILGWRGLIFAGRISYGWYVIHQPLQWVLLRSHWHALPVFQSLPGACGFAFISLALSGLIAVVSYYAFERPVLRLKKYFI